MAQVLVTGDENAGQEVTIPVPGRASPLRVRFTPGGGGGGGGNPFSNGLYLDEDTTVPVPDQNGSAITPFGDFGSAYSSVPNGGALLCAKYTAGEAFVLDRNMWFVTVCEQSPRAGFAGLAPVQLGDVTNAPGGNFLMLWGVAAGTVNGAEVALDVYLRGGAKLLAGTVSLNNLNALDSDVSGAVQTSGLLAVNSIFDGVVTADSADFTGCTTTGDITSAISCIFRNHRFIGATPVVTSPAIAIDVASFFSALAAGVTFSSPVVFLDTFRAAQYFQTTLGAVSVNTSPDNVMHAIGSANYGTVAPSDVWTFAAADCVATYIGPPGHRFRVTVTVASAAPVVTTFAYFAGAVDLAGDVLGDASFSNLSLGEMQVQDARAALLTTQFASFERIVSPTTGQSVQPVYGLGAGSEAVDLNLATQTMTIEAVP